MYLSNKTGASVIKVCELIRIKVLKVELAWAIDNLLQVISNKMLLSITYTTKKQKNKAVLIKAILYALLCGP